jgi:serine/threonine-protein kinase
VLHELLAGQVPFPGAHPVAVLRQHLEAAPPVLPVPAPLAELLAELLSKDPDERPTAEQTARRLRAALPSLAGLPPLAAAAAPIAVNPRPTTSRTCGCGGSRPPLRHRWPTAPPRRRLVLAAAAA